MSEQKKELVSFGRFVELLNEELNELGLVPRRNEIHQRRNRL